MKQILIIIFSLLKCFSSYCQNGYNTIEDFKEGTILTFQSCEPNTVDAEKNGNNITWDFSTLKATQDATTEWIVSPVSAPGAADYPQANLAEKYSDGNYIFLKKEAGKTYLLGFVNENSKIKLSYPQPVLIAKRPFSYGDKVAEPYTTDYTVNGMRFAGKGTATIEADGFGKLILPNKTYEKVLKIKMVQAQSDLMEKYNSTSDMSIITYVWFDQKHNSALLKVTEIKSQYHSEKTVEYLLKETD